MEDDIVRGQQVFCEILNSVAEGSEASFEPEGHGRFKVLIVGPKGTAQVHVPEEDFADLARPGGGRGADIEMRIKSILKIA